MDVMCPVCCDNDMHWETLSERASCEVGEEFGEFTTFTERVERCANPKCGFIMKRQIKEDSNG